MFNSTMSTGLNSMTGVIYEDMIKPSWKKPISEANASFIMKIVVVIIGVICVSMVFIVEQLGTLIQVSQGITPNNYSFLKKSCSQHHTKLLYTISDRQKSVGYHCRASIGHIYTRHVLSMGE